jgi:hypothetical protein
MPCRQGRGGADQEEPTAGADMRTALAVLAGMLVGAFAGYMAGVYLACCLLWPQSNLCGLVGVFITGPLGLVAGGVLGWFASRQR